MYAYMELDTGRTAHPHRLRQSCPGIAPEIMVVPEMEPEILIVPEIMPEQ